MMTDAERIEALLDLVEEARAETPALTRQLVVLGLAERSGRGHQPTNAGWNLLGRRVRRFAH